MSRIKEGSDDIVAITGSRCTVMALNVDGIIKSIRKQELRLADVYYLTIYGEINDIDRLFALVGFCEDKPVYQRPLITRLPSSTTLIVAELDTIPFEFTFVNGRYSVDLGDMLYTTGTEAVPGLKPVYTIGNPLNEAANDSGYKDVSFSVWSKEVKLGSKTLPYKTNTVNAVRAGEEYVFTSSFGPCDLSGNVTTNVIDQCLKNVLLSVKSFGLDQRHCYRLKIRVKRLDDTFLDDLRTKLEKTWEDVHVPLVELVQNENIQYPITIGGMFYQPMEDKEEK
jgi:hypothetical protein